MLPDNILDEEKLYRAIHPLNWDNEKNKPSSSLFKDSNGASVDRDGKRDETEICSYLLKHTKTNFGIASILTGNSRQVGTMPCYKPEKTNPYHSIIYDDDGEKMIRSRGKLRRLRNKCCVIKPL